MKIFFLIGWRNLWRNKRRSLVVIFSIALGIFVMLFSAGLMNGMNNQLVENTISTSLGHISIQRKGFQDDMKLQNSFVPYQNLTETLNGIPGIIAHSPRIKLEGMLRSSEASKGILIMGIDPEREKHVSRIYEYTFKRDGSLYLNENTERTGRQEILLSKSLAEKLDVMIGDKVVLMIQNFDQEIVGVALTVRGLYQSPIDSFDNYVAYVDIHGLQQISGMGERISEITLRTAGRERVDAVAAGLRNEISESDIDVLTWKQMAPNLLRAVELFDVMMYIFFAIIFTTVVFSIANTLIMAIMERFHEIGVMKSIGTRPSRIGLMVLFEAVNLGLVGLLTGIAGGAAFVFILSRTGINLSFYMESVRLWGTGHIIYPSLKPMDIIASAVIVFATTIVAALYPAIKAARIQPLEALYHI